MKRLIILAGIALLIGGNAYAASCWDCKFHAGTKFCRTTTQGGFTICTEFKDDCFLSGDICPPTTLASLPLSADFTVASVERIDQAAPAKAAPQIAQLHLPDLHTAH